MWSGSKGTCGAAPAPDSFGAPTAPPRQAFGFLPRAPTASPGSPLMERGAPAPQRLPVLARIMGAAVGR